MDPRTQKRQLEEAVFIEPTVRTDAEFVFSEAKRKLALKRTVMSSIAVGLCHVAFTRAQDTMAVTLTGDGNPLLMINPDFIIDIGPEGAVFVLCHEVYHLLLCHLRPEVGHRTDPLWVLAQESWINQRVSVHINQERPMATTTLKDGSTKREPSGVDPKKVYEEYKAGARKAGFEPVRIEEFYKTDEITFTELSRLPKPPKSQMKQVCAQMSGEGDGKSDGDPSKPHIDQEQVDIMMSKVLTQTLRDAMNGGKVAREELESLMDVAPDCKTWGDIGAGVLRGETATARPTEQWLNWTINMVGTKMADGLRLRYNKKVWFNPRVSSIGPEEKRAGAVFIDASGSMHSDVLKAIGETVGEDERIDVVWHSFDGSVWPFEAGESFKGGGGTSFQIIDDWVAEMDEDPDFVLVITDGYAPHISPREPDKWIWLIVPGGDTWPEAAGMSCREIDLLNGKV